MNFLFYERFTRIFNRGSAWISNPFPKTEKLDLDSTSAISAAPTVSPSYTNISTAVRPGGGGGGQGIGTIGGSSHIITTAGAASNPLPTASPLLTGTFIIPPGAKMVSAETDPKILHFTLQVASGGKVLILDRRTERGLVPETFVIPDNEDLGQAIGHIITLEFLRR